MATFPNIDSAPLPPAAAGATGFDGDAPQLVAAPTDTAIARAFLYHAELAPATLKSTKTELGRFLMWCQAQRKTLGQICIEDLAAYKAFLRDPQPVSH
jgi:integrase/recombinase XerD